MTRSLLFSPLAVAALTSNNAHAFQPPVQRTSSRVILSTTEDATTPSGKALLTNKATMDHLMKSDSFRSSLTSVDPMVSMDNFKPHPPVTDRTSYYDAEIEMEMLREKKALDHLLKSKAYRSSLSSEEMDAETDDADVDKDSAGHFEESMLSQHVALSHLMESKFFKNSLNEGKDANHGEDPEHPYHPFHAAHETVAEHGDGEYQDLDIHNDFSRHLLEEKADLKKLGDLNKLMQRQDDEGTPNVPHHFDEEMLTQHAALSHLMESKFFKTSLNDGKDIIHGQHHHPYHASHETITEQGDGEYQDLDIHNQFSRHLLEEKAELTQLMKHETERHIKQGEFDASLELLLHRGALSEVLSSTAFRSSIHPNHADEQEHTFVPRSNMADAHLHTLLVGETVDEDGEEMMPVTEFDFDLAMLRGRGALNRLMEKSVRFQD